MAQLILRPNQNGDLIELTRGGAGSYNYDQVDEVTADDGTTFNYIGGGTSRTDRYYLPDHTTESGDITSVVLRTRMQKSGNYNGCSGTPQIKTGGTVYNGTGRALVYNVWTDYDDTWALNPKTGVAWTWSDIDAIQIGVNLYDQYASHAPRITQIYLIVNYSPPQTISLASIARTRALGGLTLIQQQFIALPSIARTPALGAIALLQQQFILLDSITRTPSLGLIVLLQGEAPPTTKKVTITHPALLTVKVYRNGELIDTYDELSNLDEDRLENALEIPVLAPATLEIVTLAGQIFTYEIA